MISSKSQKHIFDLHVNGMNGRILKLPAPSGKNRQILLLYGHHASLERLMGVAEVLNKYGAVTMPDLPGFGGMDSFYKIGAKPNIDNYADYLASIIKLQYKRRRLTIVAMSFAVPLIVRTLQKYPDLAQKVDFFVSMAGFVRYDDFTFSRSTKIGLLIMSKIFSRRIPALLMRHTVLTKPMVSLVYKTVSKNHSKMKDAIDVIELGRRIDFESNLWKINDVRTRWFTIGLMLKIDLCKNQIKKIHAYHVTASEDRYFDNEIVAQHLHVIFPKVETIESKMANHAPSIIATPKQAAPYIPPRIRRLLNN